MQLHLNLRAAREAARPALAILAVAAVSGLASQSALADDKKSEPIVIQDQGAFAFAGKTISNNDGGTLHCDHGYAQYNIPVKPRDLPLVMWHSASSITWEHSPDGRDGFQQIFLRKKYPVYIIDLPRQGKASWACVPTAYEPEIGRDQATFEGWRFGTWPLGGKPKFFDGVQAPTNDPQWLDQLLRARYPEFEDAAADQFEADSVADLLKKIGPSVLITHSGSGVRGWVTALTTPRVKGIVSFEPSVFRFPKGEAPKPIKSAANGDVIPPGEEVSEKEFKKLTRIPIQIIVGDYVPNKPSELAGPERRRITVVYAKAFIKAINDRGGDAELVELPKKGLTGNTHLMMLDLNNDKVAEIVADFLKKKNLDKRTSAD
ncbi:alpha/beta hydrolase [Hansschlegelia zhihuaiae]|uniref:Alpha/beta hydrolase n=1 Tax=Hansschlegelia zhihuaiae TaxID=405005 RepID=A0A4Q0MNR3_9HYPH|nr:alpha/beta fold hydrolase [Hansschlegelia zhihuaiae]RXF75293.1 alpha/beta hydrolase [Hansschlegelia zhihuaiae]